MTKKLKLNKRTVSNLSRKELSDIKGGYRGCWENIFTMYYCDVIYTGAPPVEIQVAIIPEDAS